MTSLSDIARLKELLFGMEQDLGLDELNIVQRDIVYAATILADGASKFETDSIRQHTLLKDVSRSSFFRALKDLVDSGYIEHQSGTKRMSYKLLKK